MHPVCANLFKQKKKVLDEGGISELEKTTSGGKDLATLLSTSSLRRHPFKFNVVPFQSAPISSRTTTIECPMRLLSLT